MTMTHDHESTVAAVTPSRPPKRPRLGDLGTVGPFIALVVITIGFAAVNPGSFLSGGNIRAILDQSTLPLILAMGATFVLLMGAIDLSIEGVMASAGIAFVLLSANSSNALDLGLWAPLIGVTAGGAIGLMTGVIHTRLRLPSFMVSLGVWYIGLGIATVFFGDRVPRLTDPAVRSWANSSTLGLSNGFIIAVCVVVFSIFLAHWTKFGRYAYAIGANETIAALSSIPVARYKTYVFFFAGLCSGLAGVIGSDRIGVGIVDVGSGQLFVTVAAVVVGGTALSGGKGGVLQSVCGVFLLTVINNGLVLSGVDPIIQQAMSGVVLVAAVVTTGLRLRSRLRVVK